MSADLAPQGPQSGPAMGQDTGKIDLRILSPGQQVPETIEIRGVPVTCTIAALKDRITHLAPSHPPPDTQRLIYQGHVIANSAATLQDVFGPNNLATDRNFAIHLILRPSNTVNTSGPPSRSTSRPIPVQQNVPENTAYSQPSQHQPPPQPHPHPHPHPHPFGVRGPPPHIFPGLQMPQLPGAPAVHLPGMPPAFQMPQLPNNAQLQQLQQQQQQHLQHLQQLHMQQMQPHIQGFPSTPANNPGLPSQTPPPPQTEPSQPASSPPSGPQNQAQPETSSLDGPQLPQTTNQAIPNANTHSTYTIGPNGVRYTMSFGQTVVPPGPRASPFPGHLPPGFPQHQLPWAPTPHAVHQMHHHLLNQTMPNAEHATIDHTQPRRNDPIPSTATTHLFPVPHIFQVPPTNAPNTAYLLSSPSGPHALVYSPEGVFGTSFFQAPSQSLHPSRMTSRTPSSRLRNTFADAQGDIRAADRVAEPANEVVIIGAAQDAAPPQPDVLARLQPLITQMWLLLRILLFAYFFLGDGTSWHRPACLAGICLVFVLLRNGEVGQDMRRAIRGWWEGIVGVRAHRQQPEDANVQVTAQAAPAQAPLQTQQAEAQAPRQLPAWRARLRPVERALALFVASLWPGLGEQTVRARREEIEREQREQREREEAAVAERNRLQPSAEAVPEEHESEQISAPEPMPTVALDKKHVVAASTATDLHAGSSEAVRERKKDASTSDEHSASQQ